MVNQKIAETIREYAIAYGKLQVLQDTIASIPKGDQKTGCIGEYYAYRYLQYKHPNSKLNYGSHSEKGWDIEIVESGLRVQVKTVSTFSKTRTISPIHKGWDILHLIYLSKELRPEGFWIVEDSSIFGGAEKLVGKKMQTPRQRKYWVIRYAVWREPRGSNVGGYKYLKVHSDSDVENAMRSRNSAQSFRPAAGCPLQRHGCLGANRHRDVPTERQRAPGGKPRRANTRWHSVADDKMVELE